MTKLPEGAYDPSRSRIVSPGNAFSIADSHADDGETTNQLGIPSQVRTDAPEGPKAPCGP